MANYVYGKVTASNGVVLHYMKTSPNNTTLRYVGTNSTLKDSGYYGVNGGFFDPADLTKLLSIAVINDQPINGNRGDYGSGWYNVWLDHPPRGTLVWDPVARQYSVQVVVHAGELRGITDRGNYWAQGGISMTLGDDVRWDDQALAEAIPGGLATQTTRAGLVYNAGLNIWYVVTTTRCTPGAFRSAIKETIGSGTLVDGIFLDGGSSVSMNSAEFSYGSRKIPQIVSLINK